MAAALPQSARRTTSATLHESSDIVNCQVASTRKLDRWDDLQPLTLKPSCFFDAGRVPLADHWPLAIARLAIPVSVGYSRPVKLPYEEFDLSGVRTYPLASRKSKANAADFAKPYRAD